jgi:hypothetical protein
MAATTKMFLLVFGVFQRRSPIVLDTIKVGYLSTLSTTLEA